MARNLSAGQTVIDVMKGMGLTPPASVASSQDSTAVQLWALASEEGQQLISQHDWQFLEAEMTINTSPGVPNYALPSDWDGFVPDSAWNRTTRLPAVGHLKEYEWQMLKARNLAGTTFTMLFRIENNEVLFYEAPSTVQQIVLPYVSRGWVLPAAGPPTRDTLMQDDDVVLYDSQLFKEALRLRWRVEKGFDVTRQQAVFDAALAAAKAKDSPGRTLSLSARGGYPYIGALNIPDTGYGS